MRPISVLLVNDSRYFLDVLSRYLQEASQGDVMVLGSVSDSREAIARAMAAQPEVVCLDLQMPHMSGLVLLPRLHELLPQTIIVVLTSLDQEDVRHATLALGADGFVSKWNLVSDLLPTIRMLVSAKRGPE